MCHTHTCVIHIHVSYTYMCHTHTCVIHIHVSYTYMCYTHGSKHLSVCKWRQWTYQWMQMTRVFTVLSMAHLQTKSNFQYNFKFCWQKPSWRQRAWCPTSRTTFSLASCARNPSMNRRRCNVCTRSVAAASRHTCTAIWCRPATVRLVSSVQHVGKSARSHVRGSTDSRITTCCEICSIWSMRRHFNHASCVGRKASTAAPHIAA